MLTSSTVEVNIPAGDLKRARSFYEDTLGFQPVLDLADTWVSYRTAAGTTSNLYATEHAGEAGHTIAQWHVDDIEAEVRDLKARGVRFETYPDMPDTVWDGEIATMGGVMRAAWFTDSEGNIMCIDQRTD